MLDYLQHLQGLGLRLNTIRTHISALSQCLPLYDGNTIGSPVWVIQWVKGLRATQPPRRQLAPPWDLGIVLTALTEKPYEPLETASIEALTIKTAFLIAMVSSRRVSDLQALSSDPTYLTLNPQSAILRVNPAFLPKTLTDVALNTDIEIEAFLPKPVNKLERLMARNCPVRALTIYLHRTAKVRKSTSLFVCCSAHAYGKQASKRVLSGWLASVITRAYTSLGREIPRANPHTIRAVSSSWKEFAGASVSQIVKAGTWSSLQTFATFYRLDFASVAAHVASDMMHSVLGRSAPK
jgi:hypothetical protein